MKLNIFGAELIDGKTLNQMYNAMDEEWVLAASLMPDAHLGYSLPIGSVVVTDTVVVPAWVGYDIGCGVCAVRSDLHIQMVRDNVDAIYQGIIEAIPVGFKHNKYNTAWKGWQDIPRTENLSDLFEEKRGLKQLGTLGGGNHFIEIGYDNDDRVWVIIHSGSRGIGHGVATAYMRAASRMHTGIDKAKEGNFGFAVADEMGGDYLMDMNFCLEFALANRRKMLKRIDYVLKDRVDAASGLEWATLINKTHNHAEYDEELGGYVHRKGATQARYNEMGVIPGNMRDGSYIVIGKGNKDSLFSSSHGAGRAYSRKKAKEMLTLEGFKERMQGIKAKVCQGTLDESPAAYKEFANVMDLQKDLIRTLTYVKPILNVKG